MVTKEINQMGLVTVGLLVLMGCGLHLRSTD
jgi:hypothetical protein